ncbi:hypothetical protein BDR26DRAFT_63827 [Obelidium mucronatum]|nr:hypothetical protein BDR26DRAFT_63827 [Obelidium mucronatum]
MPKARNLSAVGALSRRYFQHYVCNRMHFNVKMTQILQNVLGPDMNLVNSEEYRWPQKGFFSSVKLRPHLHASLRGLHSHRDERHNSARNIRQLACETGGVEQFRFGVAPNAEIWDMFVILEGNLRFSEGEDFGKVVRYLQYLNENAFAILFDKSRCWLIRSREKHIIRSIEEVSWSAGGSKKKFVDFVRAGTMNPWGNVILAACKHFNVQLVDTDAFLGAGATGRVFKVYQAGTNGNPGEFFALKVVLDTEFTSIYYAFHECKHLKAANETNVVVSVVGDCKAFEGETGAAYIMSPVGVPIHREDLTQDFVVWIVQVLFALHDGGFQHGDARLANLIQVPDRERNHHQHQYRKKKLIWIDVADSRLIGEYSWAMDATSLSRSILNVYQGGELPENINKLIEEYAMNKNEAACLELADGLWAEFLSNRDSFLRG